MTLTLGTYKALCTHLADCIYNFYSQTTIVSEKPIVLTFSDTKA